MPNAVYVDLATFYEVSKEGIGLVGGFGSIPVQGLAGVVLKIAQVRDVGHFD